MAEQRGKIKILFLYDNIFLDLKSNVYQEGGLKLFRFLDIQIVLTHPTSHCY